MSVLAFRYPDDWVLPLALQDAFAYATRVQPHQALSERALICSEVTTVNNSGSSLTGHVAVTISLCKCTAAGQDQGIPSAQESNPHQCSLGSACVLQWAEPVTLPPGKLVHRLQRQILNSPALWWPIHMGEQVMRLASFLFPCLSARCHAWANRLCKACRMDCCWEGWLLHAGIVHDQHRAVRA